MEPVGRMTVASAEDTIEPVGLFIVGGDFVKDGLRYHEPYRLKLIVKKNNQRKQKNQ